MEGHERVPGPLPRRSRQAWRGQPLPTWRHVKSISLTARSSGRDWIVEGHAVGELVALTVGRSSEDWTVDGSVAHGMASMTAAAKGTTWSVDGDCGRGLLSLRAHPASRTTRTSR